MCLQHLESGWVPTCDSAHTWQHYNAAPLENQSAITMIQYPTQSDYPETDLTSSYPILLMLNTRLGNDKDEFDMSMV